MKIFLQSNGVSNFRINITGPKQDTQTFHIMIDNFRLANKDQILPRRGYVLFENLTVMKIQLSKTYN